MTIDAFHWHEALDRSSLLAQMVDEMLVQHDVVMNDDELLELATNAANTLAEIYQKIGSKRPEVI